MASSDVPATLVTEPSTEQTATSRAVVARRRSMARWWSPVAAVIWALCAIGLVGFIAFARVPIAAGWRQGRSMRVLDIWALFVTEVTTVAAPLVTPGLLTALVMLILAGCLVGLWLAMSVTSDLPADQPD